jgi:hypothetical protein
MFFRSRPRKISFHQAHAALLTLLEDVGEKFWHAKLKEVSIDTFSGVLGGMGSFSDLFLCAENNHRLTEDKEPLANALLDCLTATLYTASAEGSITATDAIAACGQVPDTLSGWRCGVCGYAQSSHYQLRALIAASAVRDALKDGTEGLLRLWQSSGDQKEFQRLLETAIKSGICPTKTTLDMRPCPSCESSDTAVSRWVLQGNSLVPAPKV